MHSSAASISALAAYLHPTDTYGNDAGMLLDLSTGVYTVQLSSKASPGLMTVGVDVVE